MRTQPYRGSHLPALIAAVNRTSGPIWEFGSGMYSTPYLHWVCHAHKRRLITFEFQEKWWDFAAQFSADYHLISKSLDSIEGPCSVALVDHDSPNMIRGNVLPYLTEAEFVILHDANYPDKYGYTPHLSLFRYSFLCRNSRIRTLVLSNQHKLEGFL